MPTSIDSRCSVSIPFGATGEDSELCGADTTQVCENCGVICSSCAETFPCPLVSDGKHVFLAPQQLTSNPTPQAQLRFFWNGIKVGKGKLQRVFYSGGEYLNHPAGTIAIYAREYTSFSTEIKAVFTVKNDSDGMTDYFETDRIMVTPSHPLYEQVQIALAARNAHYNQAVTA